MLLHIAAITVPGGLLPMVEKYQQPSLQIPPATIQPLLFRMRCGESTVQHSTHHFRMILQPRNMRHPMIMVGATGWEPRSQPPSLAQWRLASWIGNQKADLLLMYLVLSSVLPGQRRHAGRT